MLKEILKKREYPVPNTLTVKVETAEGKQSYNLPEISTLENSHIIGLFIRRRSTAQKNIFGTNLVNDAALACGFLTIQKNSRNVIDACPLEFFDRSSLQGEYVQLDLSPGVDFSRSTVTFSNGLTVQDNEVLELVFIYYNQTEC